MFAAVSHSWRWPAAALGAAALLAGCGESQHRDGTRPPSPVAVTTRIGGSRVQVSPSRVGAGPVTFIVSNQSGRPQRLTFQTDDTGGGPAGIRASTSVPLNGTAQLQVNPKSGSYQLGVGDRDVEAASVRVGPKRQSAQNVLLRP
jgi:hypothetical protein